MVNSKDVNEINSLIVAQLAAEKNKTTIPITKIDRDYKEETGERIPYTKLGYPKLVDYLKTVPGVEVFEMYNAYYVNFIGTEDSQHIVDLVSKQRIKNPSRNTRRYTGYTKVPSNSYGLRSYGSVTRTNKNISDNILLILRRYSNGLTKTELLQKLNYEYALYENLATLNDHLKALGKQIILKDKLIYENTRKKSDDSNNSAYYRYDQVDSSQTYNVVTNYQSIYNNYMTYSNSLSKDLDYNEHADLESNHICAAENDLLHEIKVLNCNNRYSTVPERSMMNYPAMTNSYQQNTVHEPSAYPENSENIIETTNQREYIFSQNKDYVSTALSKRVKFRLEKLIQNRPQGIWCTELPKLYEEEYKIPLEWTNLGFHRFSDFTAHLSDIFHIVGPQLNGDFKLYNAKEPLPDDKPTKTSKKLTTASLFDIYDDTDIEPVPTSVPASFCKQLCPDDVITIQETVGQVLVTDLKINNNVDKNENPMVEVEVVEAYSPSFFWIRLLKNKKKFNKMMTSLGEFYEVHYPEYSVPIIMLERGLNIACVFYGKWHRAIIKSVDPNCRVTVMFYDYGTVDKYPSNEIFYLHRSFTALPAQAVPCGLYSVAPHEGDKWPKRVRDWFIQWVCERPLWANIVEVDVERNSMLVTLADTSGKDDFFINDWLIDKKMAKVKKMVRIRPRNLLYERYLQCRAIKKSLNVKSGGSDQNARSTPKDYEPLSSESPLSRRINLLKQLRDISNQVESNGNKQIYQVCPTCGNYITKSVEQKIETDKLINISSDVKDRQSINLSPYEYNREKSFDKVIFWLKKHVIHHSKLHEAENAEEFSEHLNNISSFLTRDEVKKKDFNSNSQHLEDMKKSVHHFKISEKNYAIKNVKDYSKQLIKNNNDKKNNDQSEVFASEKFGCSEHLISSENNGSEFNVSITRQEKSSLIHNFLKSDKNSDIGSNSIAQWHRKIEPINWDEIKVTMNTESKQLNHHSATFSENQEIWTENLLLIPKEKTQNLTKMNESFENFIKTYHPSETFRENILKLGPEHQIVKSDVIPPMVIKTLNIIHKPYESIKIIISDDIKEIMQNNSKDIVSNIAFELQQSEYDSTNDLRNLETKKNNFNFGNKSRTQDQKLDEDGKQEFNHSNTLTEETMSETSNRREEVTIDKNNINNCREVFSNTQTLNYIYHATLETNLLERFSQLKLEYSEFEGNSELDSDDFDDANTELSASKNQDEEEKTEGCESLKEHNDNNNNNNCKIIEIFPVKRDNEINIDENRALTIIKTDRTPVFNDNESLTEDSEMDVCIEYDFMSQFYRQQTNLPNNRSTLKEINSDDAEDFDVDIDDDDDNDDELNDKSDNISSLFF